MSKFALIPDGTPQERIDHMAAVEALLRHRGAKFLDGKQDYCKPEDHRPLFTDHHPERITP